MTQNLSEFFSSNAQGSGATPGSSLSGFLDQPKKPVVSQGRVSDVSAIIAQEGADHLKPVIEAIYKQESGAGSNARTSIDGAHGGMQIIPATFQRYAKPGERIDNPDDNMRVGVRIIKDLAGKFGNDPAKIATGYFSGEGNVNGGQGSAWKNDRADGNGKRVSGYVSDILAKVGGIGTAHAGEMQAPGLPDLSKQPKWRDIEAGAKFQKLPDAEKQALKSRYFDELIAPHAKAAGADVQAARQKFMAVQTAVQPDTRGTMETVGDTARNLAAGVLKIGPTALKGVADVANMLTGDTIDLGVSKAMKTGMDAIDETVASQRFNDQKKGFEAVMSDQSKGIGDMFAYMLDNPAILVDNTITTVGSMFLPAGAAKGAVMGTKALGMGTAAASKAAVAASIGTSAAQNAADTFSTLEKQSMEDRYKGAAISAGVSILTGIATGGGAEGQIAKKMAGDLQAGRIGLDSVKRFLQSVGKEGAQEAGEEVGNIAGEATGSLEAPNPTNAAKRTAFAGTLGAVMGGGTHVATSITGNNDQQPGAQPEPAAPAAASMTPDGRIEPSMDGGDMAVQPAEEAGAPAIHPTSQTADDIVRELAAEAGVPLETVLPAAPAPGNEARAAQLWMKAGDGTITPEEQAELTGLQQAMSAEAPAVVPSDQSQFATQANEAAPATGPVAQPEAGQQFQATMEPGLLAAQENQSENGQDPQPGAAQHQTPVVGPAVEQGAAAIQEPAADPASAQAPVGNAVGDASQQAGDVQPKAAVTPPRTEKEARALRAMQGAQPQEISNGPQAAQAQQIETQGSERQQAPAPAAEQVAPKTEREAREQRRQTDILTPDGKKVAAQWDVVEADSIKASLKEGVSQPRDRTRAASNAQVLEIAGNPDFERLSDTSKTMDYGAPTLSADGLIVGGNGRFEGISRAYDGPTATTYRQAVEQSAARFGLDGEAIKGMKKPVLVRRITDDADTRQLAIQSNQAAGLQMSDMEQAALDAERMKSLEQIEISDTGDIPLTSRNMQAIQQTLGGYATNELAGMMTADGGLSQSGMRRLRNAILFSAYGKSETLARLIESPDADMKNVGTALVRAAGKLSKVRGGVADGSIPAEFDIAGDLTAAIETLSSLRAEGKRLDEFLAQGDMFGGGLSQSERAIITFLADNLRSAKAITEGLAGYAERVLSTKNSSGGLFGDAPLPTKTEVLNDATKRFADERAAAQSQQSIFDQPAPELHSDTTGGNREVQAGERNRPDTGSQSGDEAARKPEGGTGSDEGNAKPAGVNHADDFAIRPVEITEHLISTGNIKALYKAAGVKTADAFDGLPMDQRSKAYAQYVENGGQPAPPATEAYNDKVARMESEALIRRLQSDATVRQASGKPFKTEASAKEFSTRHELDDTHEVAKVEAGYVLKRLPEARRPSAIKALAERQANDPDNQRQERAFARAEKIGAAASEAVTAYENGDTSIEQFEAALAAAEKVGADGTAARLEEQGDEGYTDPYERTETRPGTTDAQKDAGRDAIRDLSRRIGLDSLGKRNRADRVSPAVLGARLVANFVAGKPNQLVGQVAKTPQDLAVLAQVYRDPRFETFRVAYLSGSKIVGELGYTSRLPGAVVAPQDLDAKIAQGMAKFGADGFYLLHNHPSGSARPSSSDLHLTTNIAAFVQGFRGHVVIDHNEYAVIARDIVDGEMRSEVIQDETLNGTDFTGNPAVPHKLLGMVLNNPRAVAGFAKELQTPQGHATLVLATRPGEVQLIVDVPMGALNDMSRQGVLKGKALIRRMARDSGSSGNRFIILPDGVDVTTLGVWAREGVFTDVVSADGVSFRETTADPVKRDFTDDGRAMEVREDSTEKDAYVKQSAANANVGDVAVVVDERTADGIVARFVAAYPAIKGMIRVVDDFAALPANVQQDARDQGSNEQDTKGAFDHRTNSIYIVRGNHTGATDFEETVFHEALGHVGMRTLLGRGFVQELNNLYEQFGGLEGLAKIARARGFDKQFGEYVRGVAKARGQNDKFTLAISKMVLAEEVFAHAAEQKPKLLDRLKALVGMLRQNLRDLGFKRLAQYGETDLLWMLQRAKVKLQSGKADGRGGWTVLKSAYGNGNGGNNSLGLEGGENTPAWEVPPPSRMDKFIYEMQDRQINLKRVQQAITEVTEIQEQFDAYQKEELYHGRVATRTHKFLDREVRPLLMDMKLKGIGMDELEAYLWARHAKERNAQIAKINPDMADGGSGLTDAQVDQYLAGADVLDDKGEVIIKGMKQDDRARLEALAARVDAINAGTKQVLLQYGLESPDTIAAWERTYKNYVPLHREDMESVTPIGMGFSVKGAASKRAMGSQRKVTDVLAHLALQREAAITRGEKNRVGLALYGLALQNKNADFWEADKVPMMSHIDDKTGLVTRIPDPTYKNKANVLVLRVGGQDRAVVFNEHDERAVRAVEVLKNLDVQSFGEIMGTLATATRYLAAINTQYNPVFGLVNGLRDVQAAALNLSSTPLAGHTWQVLKAVPSAMRAIWQIERHGKAGNEFDALYEELQMTGGTTGYREIFRMGADRAKALQQEFDGFDAGKGKKALSAFLELLDHYNTAIENGTRLAAYKAAMANGMSKDKAASVAKNVTVNFNRKGKMGREAGAFYAFFNAAVQGTARTLETLKGPLGKKIIMGGVSLGVLQALIASAGFDDDEWEDIPEFLKQRNFIIPTGNHTYLMFPMPLGFNVLPNLGRIPTELALNGGRKIGTRITDLLTVLVDSANPLGSATLAQMIAPTVVDPIVALAENKNFAGFPIAKEDTNPLQPTPGFARAKDTSSHVARGVAKGINYATGGTKYTPGLLSPTPDQIDYIFGTLTGGAGRELNKVYQSAEMLATGKDIPESKKPVVGRFFGTTDDEIATATRFWTNVKDLNSLEMEIKGRAKDGEDPAAFIGKNPEAGIIRQANRFERQISKMRSERHRIEFDEKITEQERTTQLKGIDADITNAMSEFNAMVADAKKRKPE